MRPTVSREVVASALDYDPETGCFRWKRAIKGIVVKQMAGSKRPSGYIDITLNGRRYRAYRIAWLYVYGDWPECSLDHINGVRDDNRIDNLRIATTSENMANSRTPKSNTSGRKGVTWHRECQKWQAEIRVSGKKRYLGLFDTIDAAHAAYVFAARAHFGRFATPCFPFAPVTH